MNSITISTENQEIRPYTCAVCDAKVVKTYHACTLRVIGNMRIRIDVCESCKRQMIHNMEHPAY